MANTFEPQKQERDHYLLSALYLTPLTIPQLLELSRTWPAPFFAWDTLYHRLEKLRGGRWVRRWPYAIAIDGAKTYYKLTPAGYRTLVGNDAARAPGRYSFSQMTHPWHTYWLARFIVKTLVTARRFGVTLEECYPDNTVPLAGDTSALYPDFLITVVAHDGRRYHYCIELDNATQSIRSETNLDALEWKIRRYEAWQYAAAERGENFRVLFATTGSLPHAKNIVAVAADILLDPRRELVLSCRLQDYLAAPNPFTQPVWLSQRGQRAAMIPRYAVASRRPRWHSGLLAWGWQPA